MQMMEIDKNGTAFFERCAHRKDFNMPSAHFHEHKYELYFLLNGQTKYFIDNEIYVLSAGEMIFVPKKTLHQTYYKNPYEVERILFTFDDTYLESEYKTYISEMTESKHIVFDGYGLQKITELVVKIEKEFNSNEVGSEQMWQLYFKQLLILVSRYRKKKNHIKLSQTLQLMQKVAKYIDQSYATDLTLDTLAKEFSISASHLSRSFKASTGIGLKEYINLIRIKKAEELLLTTNWSVTKIATVCGYNDPNYFASLFKKTIGITPKKYALQSKKT